MIKNIDIRKHICCLIPSEDFDKAILLANIAYEEGADFVDIRLPLDKIEREFDLTKITKAKKILSIEPLELNINKNEAGLKSSLTDSEISGKIMKLIDLKPDFIEINCELNDETRKKLLTYAVKKNVKTILAKYFDNFIGKEKVIQIMKSIQNSKPTIIKIAVLNLKTIYEAIELLSLYQLLGESKIVITGGGVEGKIIQIIAPFLGAEFSYAYLSRKTIESPISISVLKKNFDVLNQSFTSYD